MGDALMRTTDDHGAAAGDRTSEESEDRHSILDRSFETIELPISFDEYRRLPRNGSYKYEYLGGIAVLSPRPYTRSARLATDTVLRLDDPLGMLRDFAIRPLRDSDEARLSEAFAVAFSEQPPFGMLGDGQLEVAAADAIAETFAGRHGALVRNASHVICNPEGSLFGACLVTIARDRATIVEVVRRQPHLTWLFVHPVLRCHGLATQLLAHALRALEGDGWPFLYTTFLVGSHASAMWHWENGFELLPNQFSVRRRSRNRRQ